MSPSITALPIEVKRDRREAFDMTQKAQKLREEADRLESEAKEMNRVLSDLEKDLEEDEQGVIPVLHESLLWQKYPCEWTILDDPVITDKDDQEEIVRVFRKIAGGDSDMANDWFNEIPTEAELTLGDVHRIKTQGLELPVLMPQQWTNVSPLAANNSMFHGNDLCGDTLRRPYGLFHGSGRVWDPGYIDPGRLEQYPVDPTHYARPAVSGSGSDPWFKLHPALLQHARAWEVWDQR